MTSNRPPAKAPADLQEAVARIRSEPPDKSLGAMADYWQQKLTELVADLGEWEPELLEVPRQTEPAKRLVAMLNAADDLREAVAGRLCDWDAKGEPPVPLMQEAARLLRADAALSVTSPRLQEAVEIMVELADDLEAEVEQRWGTDKRLARQLKRDMAIVERARAFIERETNGAE